MWRLNVVYQKLNFSDIITSSFWYLQGSSIKPVHLLSFLKTFWVPVRHFITNVFYFQGNNQITCVHFRFTLYFIFYFSNTPSSYLFGMTYGFVTHSCLIFIYILNFLQNSTSREEQPPHTLTFLLIKLLLLLFSYFKSYINTLEPYRVYFTSIP